MTGKLLEEKAALALEGRGYGFHFWKIFPIQPFAGGTGAT